MSFLDSPFGSLDAGNSDPGNDTADDLEALKKLAAARIAARMRQQSPNVPPAPISAEDLPQDAFGSLAPAMPTAQPNQVPLVPGAPAPSLPPARTVAPLPAAPTALSGNNAPPSNGLDNLMLAARAAQTPQAQQPTPPMNLLSQPAPNGAPSLMQRLNNWSGENSSLLLALGAGLMGAPSVGTGLQRAFSNAQPVMQQNQTVQALIQRGFPEGDARMMAANPQLLTAALQKKPIMAKGMMGEDIPLTFDELTGTYRDTNGRQLGQGSANQSGSPTEDVFNQIAQQRANGATTGQLLQNVPQQMRDGVTALISGKSIPANFGPRGPARTAAINFAHAIDPDFDETLIPERVKFANGMAQTSPSSFGGQKVLMNTALQHFGDAADYISQLPNTAGPLPDWMPGSNVTGQYLNSAKNSSARNAGIVNALNDTVDKGSGEVGKLYSGNQGGGENERMQTQSRFASYRTPGELAGALEATRNLIFGKLNSLQTQRDQVYGKNGENIFPLLDPETKAALGKIDNTIAKLRGAAPAASTAAPSGDSSSPTIPAPAERRVGQIYQTPRGPARWLGSGWQMAK